MAVKEHFWGQKKALWRVYGVLGWKQKAVIVQFHLQFRSTIEFHSVPKLSHNSTHLSLSPVPQIGLKSCVISSFCQNFSINGLWGDIVQCLLGIFQSGLTARFHPALGRRLPSKCLLSSTYRSYPRESCTFCTFVGNLESLEIQEVWGLTRVSVLRGTRTVSCRCLAVCGKENTGYRQSGDGGFDMSAERVLSCTFICGPVLVFFSISKGMRKHAAEFPLISPSSPALSLLSCAGPCQEQGWGTLAAALIQLTHTGGS